MGNSFWAAILGIAGTYCAKKISKINDASSIEERKGEYSKIQLYNYMFWFTMSLIGVLTIVLNSVVYGITIGSYKLPSWITIPTGNPDVWIGFFGSLFGAVIGGLITLYVLRMTIQSQTVNTATLIATEELRTKELIEKQNMPLVNFSLEIVEDNAYKYNIENISNSPLLDGKIIFYSKDENEEGDSFYNIEFGNLKRDGRYEKIRARHECETDENPIRFFSIKTVEIRFKDILGNRYYQYADFHLSEYPNGFIGRLSIPIKIQD